MCAVPNREKSARARGECERMAAGLAAAEAASRVPCYAWRRPGVSDGGECACAVLLMCASAIRGACGGPASSVAQAAIARVAIPFALVNGLFGTGCATCMRARRAGGTWDRACLCRTVRPLLSGTVNWDPSG